MLYYDATANELLCTSSKTRQSGFTRAGNHGIELCEVLIYGISLPHYEGDELNAPSQQAAEQAALYVSFHFHTLPVGFTSAARQARSNFNAALKMPESANEMPESANEMPSTGGPQRQGAVGGGTREEGVVE